MMSFEGEDNVNPQILLKEKRGLISTIDPTKSIVTGNGVTSPVINQINNVVLTAKDSSGNNIGIGGETVFIMISNEWARGTNMNWNVVTGATTVLSSQILTKMTDNGDGTYSYSYSVSVPGKITVWVFVAVRKGVAGEYFDNTSFTPPSIQNLTTE